MNKWISWYLEWIKKTILLKVELNEETMIDDWRVLVEVIKEENYKWQKLDFKMR